MGHTVMSRPMPELLNLERELLSLRESFATLTPVQAERLRELRLNGDQPMAPGMPVPSPIPSQPFVPPPDFTAPRPRNRIRFRVR